MSETFGTIGTRPPEAETLGSPSGRGSPQNPNFAKFAPRAEGCWGCYTGRMFPWIVVAIIAVLLVLTGIPFWSSVLILVVCLLAAATTLLA
jgi:uncharacterized membrane protein